VLFSVLKAGFELRESPGSMIAYTKNRQRSPAAHKTQSMKLEIGKKRQNPCALAAWGSESPNDSKQLLVSEHVWSSVWSNGRACDENMYEYATDYRLRREAQEDICSSRLHFVFSMSVCADTETCQQKRNLDETKQQMTARVAAPVYPS
jgi:hypothetical protein